MFKDKVFNKVEQNTLYKEKMNGLYDETFKDFSFMALSSVYKKNSKAEAVQKEYIDAYINSAEILLREYNRNMRKYGDVVKIIFPFPTLTIPIIYICRHCIELSIKRTIYKISGLQINGHKLNWLWNKLLSLLPTDNENELLTNMGNFVKYIDKLDKESTKLRYPLKFDNSSNQSIPLFVNCNAIFNSTKEFINQLSLLNLPYQSLK